MLLNLTQIVSILCSKPSNCFPPFLFFQSASQGLYGLPSTNFLDSFLTTLHSLHSLVTALAAILTRQYATTFTSPFPFPSLHLEHLSLDILRAPSLTAFRSMFKLQFIKQPVLNDLSQKMRLTILSLYPLLYLTQLIICLPLGLLSLFQDSHVLGIPRWVDGWTPRFHCGGHGFDPWLGNWDPASFKGWTKMSK